MHNQGNTTAGSPTSRFWGFTIARFKKCLAAEDYLDTLEYRLIQRILGQPTEVPLVEVRIESDKLSGKILCGLVENLPHEVDFLIGNYLQEELPLHVSLVTRARTYTTDQNAVVGPMTQIQMFIYIR